MAEVMPARGATVVTLVRDDASPRTGDSLKSSLESGRGKANELEEKAPRNAPPLSSRKSGAICASHWK